MGGMCAMEFTRPSTRGSGLRDENENEMKFGLQVDLERLLERPVDVVDWKAAKKPLFREVVDAQSKEVYAV